MKVEFMRYLDYWLGVPLCFLFSWLNYISQIINPKKKKKEVVKKILLIKLSEIGAIIVSWPLLRYLKEEGPMRDIFFLTFEKNKDVFRVLGNIVPDKQILTIRDNSITVFILDTFRVIRRLRKEEIDIVFNLEFFSRFTAIISYLVGKEKRIGFYRYTFEGLYNGGLLTHYVQYNPLIHISKAYLSFAQVMKKEDKNTPELEEEIDDNDINLPEFVSSEDIRKTIEDKLRGYGVKEDNRLLLFNPGEGTLPLREWPLENFVTLLKRFLEDDRNYVILVGITSKEREPLFNSKRYINLSGKTTLPELLELFNIADALIANDCGLSHLASLTPIKKFIIFGPESPKVFGPLGRNNWIIYSDLPCSPCLSVFNHRRSACKDNKCLKIIGVDEVYELIRKHL